MKKKKTSDTLVELKKKYQWNQVLLGEFVDLNYGPILYNNIKIEYLIY